MNRKYLLSFLLLPLVLTVFRPAVQLSRLRCELLTNPKGIDATTPRLSYAGIKE